MEQETKGALNADATRRIGGRVDRWSRLAHPNKLFQSISTRNADQFRCPRECVRLPHPYPWRSAAISLLLRSRLHARIGVARGNVGASSHAAHQTRSDCDTERIWH